MLSHALQFTHVPASTAWLLLIILLVATALPTLRTARRYHPTVTVAVVLLAAAWSLDTAPGDDQLVDMSYHLPGMNLAVLMVGMPATLQFGALLLSPLLLTSDAGWQAYPFNALALLLPPLVVNLSFRMLVDRLSVSIFVFIFLNDFIGPAAIMLLTGAVLTGVLDRTGAFSGDVMWGSVFPVFFLFSWAEAFISGAVTTVFVVLKPHWINMFDDRHHLKSTNKIQQFQTACHPANGIFILYGMTATTLGAVLGALLHWLFGLMLADTVSWFALGTLAVNWFGGFLIGVAAELVDNPYWRLLLVTGLLGSLTTFFDFSLEIAGMLQTQWQAAAAATVSLHLLGSLLFTVLRIYPAQYFK